MSQRMQCIATEKQSNHINTLHLVSMVKQRKGQAMTAAGDTLALKKQQQQPFDEQISLYISKN